MIHRVAARSALLVAILVLLTTLPAVPLAARWATADNGYYQADLVCRDGMLATYIPFDQGGDPLETAVSAYHNTGDTPFDRDNTLPAADYGPQLTAPLSFTARLQSTSIQADTNDDGSINAGETYTVYARMTLRWSPELPLGSEAVLAFQQSFEAFPRGFAAGPVEDCRFQAGSESVTVEAGQVSTGASFLPPAALAFQVEQAPAGGSLRLGEQPVPPGRPFTPADLTGGRLSYSYDETTIDAAFQYRVVGTIIGALTADDGQPEGYSWGPALSADGRYLGFNSFATGVTPDDANNQTDVFVRDLQNGAISRISVSFNGSVENGSSFSPAFSADGRYVAFDSFATNLVSGDTNSRNDVFVRDREISQTTRISVRSDGGQATGGNSYGAAISADGRYIAFTSGAHNLVDGDTNTCPDHPLPGACPDIFVHDRQSETTIRVSLGPGGTQANGASFSSAISADGRYVAFDSSAGNLVSGDTNTCPNYTTPGTCPDIFVHDRQTGAMTRVSLGPGGSQANGASSNPAISADGRYVAFESQAGNLVSGDTNTCPNNLTPGTCPDIFVHDRQTGETTRVSVGPGGTQANRDSYSPAISADGRYVAFQSSAGNLVANDANRCFGDPTPGRCPDIFIHDRQHNLTTRVSVSSTGGEANNSSGTLAMAANGAYLAFESNATNLVSENDTNNNADIFVRYLSAPQVVDLVQPPTLYLPMMLQ